MYWSISFLLFKNLALIHAHLHRGSEAPHAPKPVALFFEHYKNQKQRDAAAQQLQLQISIEEVGGLPHPTHAT
jgi:hypothetical protein